MSRSKEQARRLGVIAAIPAIMTASATGATQAVTNIVQQATEHVTSSLSHLATGRFTPSQDTPASGGQYWFGAAWHDYTNESRQSAIQMATNVVDLAQKDAGVSLTPEQKLHWNQWVLAGNVNPLQASDILAGDDNEIATAKLGHLTEEMTKNYLPEWKSANLDSMLLEASPETLKRISGLIVNPPSDLSLNLLQDPSLNPLWDPSLEPASG